MSRARKAARVALLFALAGTLYSGDRTEYEGSIWAGDASALNVRLASGGRSVPLKKRNQLRIAAYNIKRGIIDREAVIKTARGLGADVLGLTEAGDMAPAIAQKDYEVVYGGAGNVLLTKFPVIEHFSKKLPAVPGKEGRTALFAKLDIGKRNQWVVLNHLANDEWPDSAESDRLDEVETIQKTIEERLDGPAIVFGDENFIPGSEAFKSMDKDYDDALAELGVGEIGTFKGFVGLKRFDYIFIDRKLGYNVRAGGRFESDGSDHWPIMAVLEPARDIASVATVVES